MQSRTITFGEGRVSPIAKLHEDILWKIFLENTETYNDKRLTTARRSSQVCQQWRVIMLKSSSIWGRCIDLNDLRQTTYDWFREVMTRAGKALLWIMGPISTYSHPPPNFLSIFINENWDRIQRLNVSDNMHDRDRTQYWTTLFKKPAPILEEFVFHDSRKGWILPSPLFKATCPALKKFEVFRTVWHDLDEFKFTMDMPASWLSKLCSLTLRHVLNASELLQLLTTTPLLESLEIHGLTTSTELQGSSIFSMVNLPKLTSVRLNFWSLLEIVAFLERITPALGCRLSMSKPHDSEVIVDPHNMKRVQILLNRYIQDYFERHPPTRVALSCDGYLELEETSISDSGHSTPSGLSIWMPLEEDDLTPIQMLFNAPFLSTVVELDIRRWRKILPFSLSAFDSVTTLWIGHKSLSSLSEHVQQEHNLIFPLLDVLKISHWEQRLGSKYREPLGSFLQHRWAINRPISVLDLSPVHENLTCDLDNLENLTGLRVKWKLSWLGQNKEEYVCGNGHPKTLCFKQNYPKNGQFMIHRHPGFSVMYGWSGQIADI